MLLVRFIQEIYLEMIRTSNCEIEIVVIKFQSYSDIV